MKTSLASHETLESTFYTPKYILMSNTLKTYPLPYISDGAIYLRKLHGFDGRIWLDSGPDTEQHGQYDIISASPKELLLNPSEKQLQQRLNFLSDSIKLDTSNNEIPFCGGAIGYFNYEHQHTYFQLNTSETGLKASYWGIYDWAVIQDHIKMESYALFLPCWNATKIQERLCVLRSASSSDDTHPPSTFQVSPFKSTLTKEHYFSAFDKIQAYIHAGDCYQINFAQRFSAQFDGDTLSAYSTLRKSLPSPYSAYLELGPEKILSLSPEQFIQIEGNHAQTKPIKGTIKRSNFPKEDEKLAANLLASIKNRAENLMIVDLLRNDFSRSCKPWTVKADTLFNLESYTNVHHLVSTVSGELKDGVTPLQFLNQCFPGGSITGAPKKRAMEIIDELETVPRNIYCGSIGYISLNGHMQTNIAIRTLLVDQNNIYCWGGGGIVSDSTAEEEYAESLQKIRVLLDTLEKEST